MFRKRWRPIGWVSLEKAEQLLQSLDIDAESERRAYYSDYEYAAALLGTTPAALEVDETGS